MGIIGSLTAMMMVAEGYSFRWDDVEEPHKVAWKACTGAIIPTGEALDMECRKWWHDNRRMFSKTLERARWCYSAANPPHNGAKQGVVAVEEIGNIKISNVASYHLNAQVLVPSVRQNLEAWRRKPKKGDRRVVAHGFGKHIWKWSWGWSAQVEIELDPVLREDLQGVRGCFYLRNGYQLNYLYPVPHTNRYYAGTTLITQKEPKSLELKPKYDKWLENVKKESSGLIKITKMFPKTLMEGWRPMANPDDPLVKEEKGKLYLKPMYGNGIRHFPALWKALEEAL